MSRFLGIDWDHNSLYLISGSANRKEIHVEQALVWQVPHTLDVAAAEAIGRQLRNRFKEAKIAPGPVLACLGRERIILKDLRYPAVEKSQEAALIQFQTAKELTEPVSRLVIDYTPSQFTVNGKDRLAIVSIARKQWLQSLQALCKGAGVPLLCVTPRPYGIARCLRQSSSAELAAPPPAAGTSVAVLTIAKNWAEFSIIRDGEVRLARPIALGENLLEDVRRNLALYANQVQGNVTRDAVQALYFAGGEEHAALQEQLREALAIPVHLVDPFAEAEQVQAEDRGGFAGLMGLARLWVEQRTPINFISPKQPKPETGPNYRKLALVAALILVFLFGALVVGQVELGKREREIADRQQKLKQATALLDKMKPEQQKLASLQDWENSALPWPDEMLELTQRFPQVKGFHVTQIMVSTPPAATVKEGYTMQMRIKGVVPAKDSHLVHTFMDRLNQNRAWQATKTLLKEGTRQTNGGETVEEFEILLNLAKQPSPGAAPKTPPQFGLPPGKNKLSMTGVSGQK